MYHRYCVNGLINRGLLGALSDITKDPIDSTRLRNGYRAEGMAVLLGGIFNTFPYSHTQVSLKTLVL
ncbi:protein of unknown function [Streptococcus thermophilus]|uniref:Uncharacterized protein n=1 Tax=Streptococcus thermophilus TaxID=1308 RepID=A0A8D6UAE4_STRTR|nr:protein of unknown function [Streptococcus thermophilus]CAD0145643.1 protein of unknown function [Streptococcus thermophilus]CAD0152694.1 protein of unknown function [Streptococcus thermophilus]